MNITDEIMLTSLALGELQGDEKKKALNLVTNDLAAKSFFDDMVGLTTELKAKMSEEDAPGLDPKRRGVIEKVTGSTVAKPGFFADLRPFAVAAGMILAISGAISFAGGNNGPRGEELVITKELTAMKKDASALTVSEYRERHQTTGTDTESQPLSIDQVRLNLAGELKPGDLKDNSRITHSEVTISRDRGEVVDRLKEELKRTRTIAPDQAQGSAKGSSSDQHGNSTVGVTFLNTPGGGPAPGGGGSPVPGSPGNLNPGSATTGGAWVGGSRADRGGAKPGKKSLGAMSLGLGGGAGGGYFGRHSGNKRRASRSLDARKKSQRLRKRELIAKGLTNGRKARKFVTEMQPRHSSLDETTKADSSGESYAAVRENDFSLVGVSPLSTIGLDVDTASYANVRRHLNSGVWPPKDAVRVDEMVNYFHYDDPQPEFGEPLRIHAEVASCPWNLENRLLRIGFRAKTIARDARGPSNLVFLIDVSGSMKSADKLPLLVRGLKAMVKQLGEDDRVTIVTYAGSSGLVLPATRGHEKSVILAALDRLTAKGSTHGASGIELAYKTASENFDVEGTNRVILCTDGDFNVGVSDTSSLIKMIKEKAKTGIFLSVLGFGTGNIKDDKMEALANKGNGHYAYIDSNKEANKVLVEELEGTLVTVAKDCKLQVEFNPTEVASYRLLGYTNRLLAAEDFNDDTKDAGEIGAGHTVVALYEIRPAKNGEGQPLVDPLKYQKQVAPTKIGAPGEVATVKVRYKLPNQNDSRVRILTVVDQGKSYGDASTDFKLSSSVALFAMILSRSQYVGQASLETAFELSLGSFGAENDPRGLRKELSGLIQAAKIIAKQTQRK